MWTTIESMKIVRTNQEYNAENLILQVRLQNLISRTNIDRGSDKLILSRRSC